MAQVFLNPAAVKQTAVNKALPLVEKMLTETHSLAKRYAPKRRPRPYDQRPTGRLQRSIKKRGPVVRVRTISGRVGSTLRYAAAVHEGAAPHRIVARRARLLSFWWEKHNVRFAGKAVNHPGVPARSRKQYLWLPLTMVARRHGFKVRRMRSPLAGPLADI